MKILTLIRNNAKGIKLQLYDGNNNLIDFTDYTYENIFLKAKKEDELIETVYALNITGSLMTEGTLNWISFDFNSTIFDTLDNDTYICEVIIEKTPSSFVNANIDGTREYRFKLIIVDSFI